MINTIMICDELTYKDKASNWGPHDVDIVASNYFRDGISAVPGNPTQMSLAGNTIQLTKRGGPNNFGWDYSQSYGISIGFGSCNL